jgi:hypothetical protein
MNCKFLIHFFLGFQAFLLIHTASIGAEYKFHYNSPGASNGQQKGGRINAGVPNCVPGISSKELDINNVRARYMNQGDMFWDPALGLPRYEIPKVNDNSTRKNSVFAAAIWLGGIERGTTNVVVMAQTYRESGRFINYWPGPIRKYNIDTSYTKTSICAAWDQHFKCNRQTVKKFKDDFEAGIISDCEVNIPDEIKFWPGKGNPYLKQDPKFQSDPDAVASINNNLANFFDRDSNGVYNPCKGDFPLWAGTEKDLECAGTEVNINSGADQVIWWVCNDVGNNKTFPENTSLVPGLGMEVQYEAFAYASTDATNDMTFLRQKLYNKGNFTLENTYLAQWMDPDLGNYNDDYVGCDVLRGLAICYNGDDDDEGQNGYGINPPAVGVDFFRGPFPDDKFDETDWDLDCNTNSSNRRDTNERIVMSGFIYYNSGGNPVNGDPRRFNDFYNYLQNRWKNGQPVSFGGDGTAAVTDGQGARYMFPNVTEQSDPYGFACKSDVKDIKCIPSSCGSTWNEKAAGNAPGDRRFLANNGPFTLLPGSVNECTIGIVWARASGGGATGSFGKLLSADDLAQERFNSCFKRNVGPNNPNLEISELDRTLIFKIIPDTIVRKPLMTTETYFEENRAVSAGAEGRDVFFRFQGYKIYQLVDDKVSVQDLDNPDKARLLDGDINGDSITDFNGLMDIADNTSSISNLEFNPDLNTEVITPKVKNTPNKGIFNSFQVTRDMFSNISGGKISNFKKYYYAVVAYGFNDNSEAKKPYIQGVLNYKLYTAIPHKVSPEAFGSIFDTRFGDGFEVTKISGIGNGGNLVDIDDEQEKNILENGKVDKIRYLPKTGPLDIKVYNPKGLKSSNFQIKFSNRLRYKIGNYAFKEGDTLESSDKYTISDPDVLEPIPEPPAGRTRLKFGSRLNFRKEYKKGIAKVLRVIPSQEDPKNIFDLDIEIIGQNGGDFAFDVDRITLLPGRDNVFDTLLVGTKRIGCDFWVKGNPDLKSTAIEFAPFDYWALKDLVSEKVVYNQNPVSRSSEELLPEYGISIRARNGISPGSEPFNKIGSNGALESTYIFNENPLNNGLSGYDGYLRQDKLANGENYYALDPLKNFNSFANGTWAPYALGQFARSIKRQPNTVPELRPDQPGPYVGGPQLPFKNGLIFDFIENSKNLIDRPNKNISLAKNVNIVITKDQSKWTRCIVLQNDSVDKSTFNAGTGEGFILSKSRLLSVNKSFTNDGSKSSLSDTIISRGMSWFPGYAIDIDRGVRLNMMFSESMLADTISGNNLKWDPQIPSFPPLDRKSFIYVLNSPYDECKKAETFFDNLYIKEGRRPVTPKAKADSILPKARAWHLSNIMYFGSLVNNIDFNNFKLLDPLTSDLKIKLRVQRSFENFSNDTLKKDFSPIYEFNTSGSSGRNVASVGKSVLDLIRIVPNPYLSVSGYENSQVDSRVKIINLPTQCVVSIFNLSGTLVRQFNFDQTDSKPYSSVSDGAANTNRRGDNFQTFLEWDLKNQVGVPIASGVYIIHVNSKKFGEKVIKWFGVLRPIDLDSF